MSSRATLPKFSVFGSSHTPETARPFSVIVASFSPSRAPSARSISFTPCSRWTSSIWGGAKVTSISTYSETPSVVPGTNATFHTGLASPPSPMETVSPSSFSMEESVSDAAPRFFTTILSVTVWPMNTEPKSYSASRSVRVLSPSAL